MKKLTSSLADNYIKEVLFFLNDLSKSKVNALTEETLLDKTTKYLLAFSFYRKNNKDVKLSLGIIVDGEKKKINLLKDSSIVYNNLFEELKNVITDKGLNFYITNVNKAFDFLNINDKIAIFNAENQNLIMEIKNFIDLKGEGINIEVFIKNRLNLTLDLISGFGEKEEKYPNLLKDDDIEVLHNLFNLYLDLKIDYYICSKKIFQIYYYLKEELNSNEDAKVIKALIEKIIYLNNSFLIESKDEIHQFTNEYESILKEEDLEHFNGLIFTNPANIKVEAFKTNQGNLTKTDLETKPIHTVIRFSLPYSIAKENGEIILSDDSSLYYEKIKNKVDDPIYKGYKSVSIAGMGWNHFTDTYHSLSNENLHIILIIKKPYHPDFEIKENKIVDIDFKDKSALIGRDYYPHKEFVIKTLIENYDKFSSEIKIDRKNININLFSSFIVDYIDSKQNYLLLRRLYAITNPDSYTNASNKFLERLNELNLSNQYIPIRDLCENAEIYSEKTLSTFIVALIKIVLKNNVELHGNYRYFWTDNKKPKTEPQMQPFVMSQLKAISEFMGIQISREVESANGEIDFLCSYTHQNKVLKTCIEIKNAHSSNIETGLQKQLPEYLKSERTKNGIYLVLWYKGELFDKPKKHSNIDDLITYLDSIKPRKFLIRLVGIDCNKPISPSKLK